MWAQLNNIVTPCDECCDRGYGGKKNDTILDRKFLMLPNIFFFLKQLYCYVNSETVQLTFNVFHSVVFGT